MTSLAVPNRFLALAPIVVTSPTARCGTTLVQRLLCASCNAFVFGEHPAQYMRQLTAMFAALLRHSEENGAATDGDFERALAGALTDWRPGLAPPMHIMINAWVQTYYQIPTALDDFARA